MGFDEDTILFLYEITDVIIAGLSTGSVYALMAVGMTLDEVALSRGKPTKTSVRKTEKGESGRWEYIDYEEVKNYATRVNPATGAVYRQLISVTQVEKGRTAVEFVDNVITAIEESENQQGGNVRIIVPPVVYGW